MNPDKEPLLRRLPPRLVAADLRAESRCFFARATPVQIVAKSTFDGVLACVRDITTTAIGLSCVRALPVGIQVAINWNFGNPRHHRTLRGRVVSATWGVHEGWIVGCTLTEPLAEEALRVLLGQN